MIFSIDVDLRVARPLIVKVGMEHRCYVSSNATVVGEPYKQQFKVTTLTKHIDVKNN